MPEDHGVVRRVAWRQVCPWLIIFRCFRLSTSLPILFLATLGVLLTPLGWKVSESVFVTSTDREDREFAALVERNSQWPMSPPPARFTWGGDQQVANAWPQWLDDAASLRHIYWQYATPFRRMLAGGIELTQFAYWLFGALWMVAVWSFFGGTISRIAAVSLGRDERLGFFDALRYARRNYFWYFLSPWFPILGLVACASPVIALGWLMRLDVGALVAGFVWPLVLLVGLVLVVFLIGLMFGWPLLFPTISSEEGSDAFEAFSRSYSYTFQRPLNYLFYAFVSLVFGAFCWIVVASIGEAVIQMSLWAAHWGSGQQRIVEILGSGETAGLTATARTLIQFFSEFVRAITTAFNFAFFWCAATATYLLLRRDVDNAEFDEVFVEDDGRHYGLPPLPPEPSDESRA